VSETSPQPPTADADDLAGEDDWSWTDEPDGWVPPDIDVTKPSVARMYDYYLGGKDNFEVDRQAAEKALAAVPDGFELARANRRFLVEAVGRMTAAGIDQFLDLGAGLPTSPTVHEVARETHPSARVAYLDNDPIVLAHGRALLAGTPGVAVLPLDLRRPLDVLADESVRRVLDLQRPVGVLLIAVLHFVPHDLAYEIVARYRDAMAPGSWLAISAATTEGLPPEALEKLLDVYKNSTAQLVFRSRAQVDQLFDGFEVEGGLRSLEDWFPGTPSGPTSLCGVARKV
jgi:hypothetical protein